jgi:hypothetical protein
MTLLLRQDKTQSGKPAGAIAGELIALRKKDNLWLAMF